MPTPTYTPLANITLGSSAASVTFSSISGSYRDLVLVYAGSRSSGGVNVVARLNSDTGSNYSAVYMAGNGSSTLTGAGSSTSFDCGYYPGTGQANFQMNLMDYSATDKHKTALIRTNDSTGFVAAYAHRWANTAAVTSILIFPGAGTLDAGTTLALYGIAS